ncbi:prepilin-type N-terminal cleavage/methylation domain-containing protein, partial [Psychrobacter sp. TB55-MNA-CIBAN-0194]
MAILHIISSNCQQLSVFILLKLLLAKNKLARTIIFIYTSQISSINHKQTILNQNVTDDKHAYKLSSQNGFTLVELIVTVAILA